MKVLKYFSACAWSLTSCVMLHAQEQQNTIVLAQQGSFAVGGRVLQAEGTFDLSDAMNPQGQTFHGDHAYVFYQMPKQAHRLPLVFLHGAGQSKKTWESTPDGREGFQNIFLKRGFGVYLLDQPRRGAAGKSMVGTTITPIADEQFWFTQFRIGNYPDFFPNVQFPKDKDALIQFFRQMTPNTGSFDGVVVTDALSELFTKVGDGILVTHSQGGGPGWSTAMRNEHVKAIVAYEPYSGFVFPEGEAPAPIASTGLFGALKGGEVPKADFLKLTKIPIVIYYGDNIASTSSTVWNMDHWRSGLEMAKLWAATINKYGGDATVVHLPEVGIKGNTHFPFSDLNNKEVADHLWGWLNRKGLVQDVAVGDMADLEKQQVIKLSKQKWQWMADKNTALLDHLFDAASVFVHMGGSWGKEQELQVIKSGGIWYKKADVHEVSVHIMDQTAVVLNRIDLLAVVGGNEVTNPFIVTEVYVKKGAEWKLGSLYFTKVSVPVRSNP